MEFKELSIQNFGSIADLTFPLDNQGLILITGVNKDDSKAESNGAGKSLLLDAFTWCAWGKTVRGFEYADEVVHEVTGKNCLVSLSFTEDGHTYTIYRYQKNKNSKKPNDLELWYDGTDVSSRSISATQDKINSILGLDFVTFCAMMPGAGVNIAELTDSSIKELLEKLLQTELLSQAKERANEKLKWFKNQKELKGRELTKCNEDIQESLSKFSSLQEKSSNFESDKQKRKESVDFKIQQLTIELEEKEKKINNKGHVENELTKARQRKTDSLEKEKKLLADLDKIKVTFSDSRASFNADIISLEKELNTLIDKRDKLESIQGQCFVCSQTVEEENKEVVLQSYDQEINTQKQTIENTKKELKELEAQYDKDYQVLAKELKSIRSEQQLANKDLEHFQDLLTEINTAEEVKKKSAEYMNQLTEQKESIEKEENPFESMMAEETSNHGKLVEQKVELEKEISEIDPKIKILEFWYDGFSQSGIRSYMLEHVTPILNSAAEKYSRILTNNEMSVTFNTKEKQKNGKVKEKFNVKVSQRHGGSSYRSNSTGERARANLVTALSIGDLAELRTNKQLPFRFLDEPFEGVDNIGQESVLSLLNEKSNKCNSVFVITHNDNFKKLFNKQWTIVKQNSFSAWE